MQSETEKRPIFVVGCGIIGLTTAIHMRQVGHEVVIYAKETPSTALSRENSPEGPSRSSEYASFAAAGLWVPSGLEDAHLRDWAAATFAQLKKEAGEGSGVRMVEGYSFHKDTEAVEIPWFSKLTTVSIETPQSDLRLPPWVKSAHKYVAPVADMKTYLPHQESLARKMGIVFEVATVSTDHELDLKEISAKAQSKFPGQKPVIVICSGVGSEALSGQEVIPVRGVTVRVERPRHLDYFVVEEKPRTEALNGGFYGFGVPHGDEYLIGDGSSSNSTSTEVDTAEIETIMKESGKIFPGIENSRILSTNAGLRPVLATGEVRVGHSEISADDDGLDVIENYGHTGRGFTLCWGCAESVAEAVEELDRDQPKLFATGRLISAPGVGI